MTTKEVQARELQVGDTIVAKQGGKRYKITELGPGMGGQSAPYLVLLDDEGRKAEHDTFWDSLSATYTVEVRPKARHARRRGGGGPEQQEEHVNEDSRTPPAEPGPAAPAELSPRGDDARASRVELSGVSGRDLTRPYATLELFDQRLRLRVDDAVRADFWLEVYIPLEAVRLLTDGRT